MKPIFGFEGINTLYRPSLIYVLFVYHLLLVVSDKRQQGNNLIEGSSKETNMRSF